jgi:transcription elongation factor GreA
MEMQYVTQEKFDSLKAELKDLQENKTLELANRIDEARQNGDLSENAEYHQAREDLSWVQGRIKEIDLILRNSEIIKKGSSGGVVDVGSTLDVEINGKSRTFSIVGAQEADPMNGKISNESPLGSAFLGKKKGDKITITVPAGEQEYKIKSVS